MIRFRLVHGPIDCLFGIDGSGEDALAARRQAEASFGDVLPTLCREMDVIRRPVPGAPPRGPVARAMHRAVSPFSGQFITPMAAVAGAVADHLLAALARGRTLRRAFVNNGGDIAVHLAPGETLRVGMVADLAAPALDATAALDRSCGVATSGRACKGRGGRSFSFGIADAVTVVARTAAMADAAATVIGNAVDLPGHPAIARRPAHAIDPDSDLGGHLVTWDVGALAGREIEAALDAGLTRADALRAAGLIDGAALSLRRRLVTTGATSFARLEAA